MSTHVSSSTGSGGAGCGPAVPGADGADAYGHDVVPVNRAGRVVRSVSTGRTDPSRSRARNPVPGVVAGNQRSGVLPAPAVTDARNRT